MHPLLVKVMLIGAGGALGAMARFGLAQGVQRTLGEGFPWGVMSCNVLGCLVIGVLAAVFANEPDVREEWRLAIFIGVLGGFTTFSTFSYETFELLNESQWTRAGLYVLGTNVLCLSMTLIGYRATASWLSPS